MELWVKTCRMRRTCESELVSVWQQSKMTHYQMLGDNKFKRVPCAMLCDTYLILKYQKGDHNEIFLLNINTGPQILHCCCCLKKSVATVLNLFLRVILLNLPRATIKIIMCALLSDWTILIMSFEKQDKMIKHVEISLYRQSITRWNNVIFPLETSNNLFTNNLES